jgi:hypothetical protein
MGWLAGWTYRKNHVINPASGAGQNYQKRIVVHFGAGIDNDENVYLDGKCLANFGDIRFTSSTGNALLDYYIEKKVDSDYAVCWVEITDDLDAYDRKIYIYYGKAGAASVASGDATFIFFDDFEVDLSKWQFVAHASISTDHAYNGTKCVKLDVVGGSSGQVGKLLTQLDVAIHAHYYDVESVEKECHAFLVSDGAGHDSAIGVMTDISQYEYMPDAFLPTPTNTGIDRTVGWHEFIVKCTADSLTEPWLGGSRQFIIDGILMPITTSDYANIFILTASNGGANPATGPSYWDSVFITKFIPVEPTHGTWGVEENDGVGVSIFEAEDVSDELSGGPLDLEDTIYSLAQKPMNIEDILVSLSLLPLHIPALLSEDVVFALSETRRTVEDLIKVLLFSTLHTSPFSSEEVISALRALRTYDVISEIPSGVMRRFLVVGSPVISLVG